MIDVVCDAGSRYTKLAAGRGGARAVVTVTPSRDAVDLGALARRAAQALDPGLLEPTRIWLLGDAATAGGLLGGALARLGPLARRAPALPLPPALARAGAAALGEALARLGPLTRLAPPLPLTLGAALARATGALAPELLVADCGALRTRVFEVARGHASPRTLENERCTAGAGRFVETMAVALRVGLAEIDACAAGAQEPCRVSSPCPVFAESEVVSQLNAGRAREDVLAGVVAHAAEKVATLVGRARPGDRPLLLVGGLARLAAFRAALAARLPGVRLLEPPVDPLLLPCLAGLAQVAPLPAGSWPAVETLPGAARDAA